MKRLRFFLKHWGIHAFLLPIFFVVHNYLLYNGLVSATVSIKALLQILLFTSTIFLLAWETTKHVNKSLLLTTLVGFVFLFFGVIKDFLEQTLQVHYLTRYIFFLPLILIITLVLARNIAKKKSFDKANLFLNLLLLAFLVIDIFSFAFLSNAGQVEKNRLTKKQSAFIKLYPIAKEKPDIYYLVFDCYPGTAYLRNHMQFDNSHMDTMLMRDGFYVVQNPTSNYNRTAFSIASTFNFQYLQTIRNNVWVTPKEYNRALLTVDDGDVINILKNNGYQMVNLSVFNINGVPPLHREHFLTIPEESVIIYNTLGERVKRDILWNFIVGKYTIKPLRRIYEQDKNKLVSNHIRKRDFNHKLIDSLKTIPQIKSSHPKFIYAHFEMPHPPFFYNEKGESNDLDAITNASSFRDKSLFLSYLKYTNSVIQKVYTHIKQYSENKAVIILESDHGFTDFDGAPEEKSLSFKNYIAFYFPDGDYKTLYHTMSNINTFPVLFNKYFHSNIPLQKDSSIFLPN